MPAMSSAEPLLEVVVVVVVPGSGPSASRERDRLLARGGKERHFFFLPCIVTAGELQAPHWATLCYALGHAAEDVSHRCMPPLKIYFAPTICWLLFACCSRLFTLQTHSSLLTLYSLLLSLDSGLTPLPICFCFCYSAVVGKPRES